MKEKNLSDDVSLEFVPHKSGILRADRVVAITIRATAKERHLWQLAVLKKGTTISEAIRDHMNQFVETILTDDDLEHL